MRLWLVLLGTLPLVAVGSGALAGTPPTREDAPIPACGPKATGPGAPTAATAAPEAASIPDRTPEAVAPGATARTAAAPAVRATPARRPAAVGSAAIARRLAVAHNGLIATRGRDAIYLIDPDRGSVYKVPGTADLREPAWAPDGGLLAVERADNGVNSVYTVRADGSRPHLVLRNASSLSWSQNGDRLFVVRDVCAAQGGCQSDEPTVLISVRPDGTDAHAVTPEGADFYEAAQEAWPADGNWITFFDDVSSGPTPALFDSTAAAWSPDGKKLAFVSTSPTAAERDSGDSNAGLWIVNADGSELHLLVSGSFGPPSWAPSPSQRN